MPVTRAEIAAVNATDAIRKNRELSKQIEHQQKLITILVNSALNGIDVGLINKLNKVLREI
jgi:hypothetical protein